SAGVVSRVLAILHRRLGVEVPLQVPRACQRIYQPIMIMQRARRGTMRRQEASDLLVESGSQHEGTTLACAFKQEVCRRWQPGRLQKPLPAVLPYGEGGARVAGRAARGQHPTRPGELVRIPAVVLVGE